MSLYSQFDEETHLFAILDEIGDGTKICSDIGARLEFSNVARLIEERCYQGNLVDTSPESCAELRAQLPTANVRCEFATIANINDLVPRETWVLSIDIDSHDWWLWANLKARPAIVIMETTPDKGIRVAEYGCERKDKRGYGASLGAMQALGAMKRYDYITCTEVNAIFVRGDLKCKYRYPEPKEHHGVPTSHENNVL